MFRTRTRHPLTTRAGQWLDAATAVSCEHKKKHIFKVTTASGIRGYARTRLPALLIPPYIGCTEHLGYRSLAYIIGEKRSMSLYVPIYITVNTSGVEYEYII